MVKLPAVLLRGIKPSAGIGLESPNSTHIAVAALTAGVIEAIVETQFPRRVEIDLRRTPIVVKSKTANSNSVYIQLV